MPPDCDRLTLTLADPQDNRVTLSLPDDPMPRVGPSGRMPALRFGDDIGENTLTLTVRLEGAAATCAALRLQVYFDPHLVAANALERPQADDKRRPPPEGVEQSGKATFAQELVPPVPQGPAAVAQLVATPGWTAQLQAGDAFAALPSVLCSRVLPLVGDGGACTASFTINRLKSPKEAWTAGSVTVVVLDAPSGIGRGGVDLPVRTSGLPTGALQVAWAPPGNGEVILTRVPARPENNQLVLQLSNGNLTRDLIALEDVVPGRVPALHFSFVYADEAPGYGALCTRAQIERTPPRVRLAVPAAAAELVVRAVGSLDNPSWSLLLSDGAQALLTAGASLDVVFDGIVSELPLRADDTPDITELAVRWENIPGMAAGETALPITKDHATVIYDLRCDPPQGTAIDYDQVVKVSWRTRGAARSFLAGAVAQPTEVQDGGLRFEQTIRCRAGTQVLQVLAFADRDASAPASVSPAIVVIFKDVRIDAFTAAFEGAGDTLELVLSWHASNADRCVLIGAKASDETPVPTSTGSWRIPQHTPDYEQRFTLTAVGGNLGIAHRAVTYQPRIGDRCQGGIVFALNEDRCSGWVVGERDDDGPWNTAFMSSENVVMGNKGGVDLAAHIDYTDWHLPSVAQLLQIAQRLVAQGDVSFQGLPVSAQCYWAADVDPDRGVDYRRCVLLSNEWVNSARVQNFNRWRAVRAFSTLSEASA